MNKYFGLFIILWVYSAYSLIAQTVTFQVAGEDLDPVYNVEGYTLSLGVNASATSGPSLDNLDTPGVPPQLFATFKSSVIFAGNETPLIKDFKNNQNALVWILKIEFGNTPSLSINWSGNQGNQFSAFTTSGYSSAQLIDGAMIVNMLSVDQYTFTGTINEVRNVYIVIRKPGNQLPLVAKDDVATTAINSPVIIDVLSNDFDTTGSTNPLSINSITQPTSANAVTQIVNGRISYTPNNGFTGPSDTFTYTIKNGGSATSSSANVTVLFGQVTFSREHEKIVDNDDGLIVMINISHAVTNDTIVLTEIFPPTDNAMNFYFIPNGSGKNGLAIDGIQPNSVTVNGNTAIFTWNSTNLPSTFSLKYRLKGGNSGINDKIEKIISGMIMVGSSADEVEVVTKFTPGKSIQSPQPIFHPSDPDHDQRITLFEFLDYAGPIADAFQLGVPNGAYCYDGLTISPKSANPCSGTQVLHDADSDQDGKISIFEYLDYAGPVADVFQLGFNGAYCVGTDGKLNINFGLGCH